MKKMDPDAFWDLIAGAKRECGQDMDASLQWLTERLTALGPQQAQDFHDILHGYKHLAYKYGLWTAATLMCEHGCSDDGFIDFRAWLIAQGKEVYLAALADPDSLADVEPYGGCQLESFSYVASKVLNTLTGRGAYVALADFDALVLELAKGIQYGEGIGYPSPRRKAMISGTCRRRCGRSSSSLAFVWTSWMGFWREAASSMRADFPYVYPLSRSEALRRDETQMHEDSFRENVKCAWDIEKAVRDCSDEGRTALTEGCAQSVLEAYGFKRVRFVLSNSLGEMAQPRQISEEARQWARVLLLNADGTDRNLTSLKEQLWYAADGLGCRPENCGCSIRAVRLADGGTEILDRGDFAGVLDERYLPDWAAEKLAELRTPQHQQPEAPSGGMEMT